MTEAQQIECYGTTIASMKQATESALRLYRDPAFYAMAILSDAQQEMEFGQVEGARKTINQAKWVLSQYVMQNA